MCSLVNLRYLFVPFHHFAGSTVYRVRRDLSKAFSSSSGLRAKLRLRFLAGLAVSLGKGWCLTVKLKLNLDQSRAGGSFLSLAAPMGEGRSLASRRELVEETAREERDLAIGSAMALAGLAELRRCVREGAGTLRERCGGPEAGWCVLERRGTRDATGAAAQARRNEGGAWGARGCTGALR